MLQVVVVVGLVAVAGGVLQEEWEAYKTRYNKQYHQHEDSMRRYIYEVNLKLIETHNAEADTGKHTYRLASNHFADWTHGEFLRLMSGLRASNSSDLNTLIHRAPVSDNLPGTVDWREKGYVTRVKNQLFKGDGCAAGYAFSATGALEGQHFRFTGKLVSLSEQNIVDCSKPQGNVGCRGGLMNNAFEYIKLNMGIDTEESYPFKGMDGECMFNPANVGATDTGFIDVQSMDEMALKDAVARVGPISVAIDASHSSFQFYSSGVYIESQCSSTSLDHPVLVVGYGSVNDTDYWIVKNSWGVSWGMEGYILMARNKNNMCGIATKASYPTI